MMASQRHFDFRGGDLSEELGLVLLKGIAAVAPVPRPEDVGIDAVATLFRLEGDLLVAEDSFYVQLKSSSEKSIRYKTATQVAWLQGLKLPFMIGSVDKATATIALFGTNNLAECLINDAYTEYRLYFKKPPKNHELRLAKVALGEPVLVWQTTEIGTRELVVKAYSVLKPYFEVEQRNVELRPIRTVENIEWKSNKPGVTLRSMVQIRKTGSIVETRRLFRSMTPGFLALGYNAITEAKQDELKLAVDMVEVMRRYGHNPDPNDTLGAMLRNWNRLVMSRQATPITAPTQQQSHFDYAEAQWQTDGGRNSLG